jgi:hypothetical protein
LGWLVTLTVCVRARCGSRSAAPQADGWVWVETGPLPGWWCHACHGALLRVLDRQGMTERPKRKAGRPKGKPNPKRPPRTPPQKLIYDHDR